MSTTEGRSRVSLPTSLVVELQWAAYVAGVSTSTFLQRLINEANWSSLVEVLREEAAA